MDQFVLFLSCTVFVGGSFHVRAWTPGENELSVLGKQCLGAEAQSRISESLRSMVMALEGFTGQGWPLRPFLALQTGFNPAPAPPTASDKLTEVGGHIDISDVPAAGLGKLSGRGRHLRYLSASREHTFCCKTCNRQLGLAGAAFLRLAQPCHAAPPSNDNNGHCCVKLSCTWWGLGLSDVFFLIPFSARSCALRDLNPETCPPPAAVSPNLRFQRSSHATPLPSAALPDSRPAACYQPLGDHRTRRCEGPRLLL